MLRLTTNKGMAVYHLAKKAKNVIPQYELRNAMMVNVPFVDETVKRTRYLTFYRNENEWGFTGIEDKPVPEYKPVKPKKKK